MPLLPSFRRLMGPLRSRKVRVGLATVLAAFAVEIGLDVSDELMLSIVGIGVAIILGIAREDAGRWAASLPPTDSAPPTKTKATQ